MPTSEGGEAGFRGVLALLRAFRDERDWQQFHTPRHLGAALSIEVAELQELFLWKSDGQVSSALLDTAFAARVKAEIADVLIYALILADSVGIDPDQAVREKISLNAKRYPVEKARGNAEKATELGAAEG